MKQEYTFKLEFINEILHVLGEQKAKDTFEIILKIHQEVQKQNEEVKE
jgi:hypothetical protein